MNVEPHADALAVTGGDAVDHGHASTASVVLDGARIAALKDLGLLDTEAEEDFDRYTRLAADLLGVPVSLVSLVDADRQFIKSQSGLPGELAAVRNLPLSHSLCQYAVASQQPLIVSDAREHPLVADSLAIRDLGLVAYAGMPLVLSDGHAVGAFCAIDTAPRAWSDQDLRILGDLAAAVTAHLELRKSLAERSLHDPLTGLANRALLCAQADQLLEAVDPADLSSVAALCIGLDGFGLVNDAYGALAADRVLQQIAQRLAVATRRQDVLGRVGGDVFAVVGQDMGDERAVLDVAGRLRAVVSDTVIDIEGHSVGVTATIGLATGMLGRSGADLLSGADDAMRRGKSRAGAVLTAVDGTGEVAAAHLRLRGALAGALARGEMHVVYQPIVALDSGSPIGFEALVRWDSPTLGSISPVVFIPVAERTGEIVKIGEWVLREACAQLAAWRRDGAALSISVNLAPLQLELPNLVDVVRSALSDHGLPASALTLEITEGVLIDAGALQALNLQRLRELGVTISLDDFGTGYSALGYLKRFPIDQLKIDRSFVTLLEADRRDAALVQAILALARGLDLRVVAEGIETAGQHRLLQQFGCELGQGYRFSRPCPAAEFGPTPHLTVHAAQRP
jgi:diguanylate cyclase (GGDEF)-like protein